MNTFYKGDSKLLEVTPGVSARMSQTIFLSASPVRYPILDFADLPYHYVFDEEKGGFVLSARAVLSPNQIRFVAAFQGLVLIVE